MRRTALFTVFLVVLLAAPALTRDIWGCETYSGRRVQYFSHCRCYSCAYTGDGCTVCTDGSSWTCYTNSATCGPLNPEP